MLYVALTRATQQLTVVSAERDEPDADGVPDLLQGLTGPGGRPVPTGLVGESTPVRELPYGDRLLAWCGTGSIQAPGPNLRRYERPLAARRAWRVGVTQRRKQVRVTSGDAGLLVSVWYGRASLPGFH